MQKKWIEIVHSPIELNELQGYLEHPDAGAHGWFLGVTRRTTVDQTGKRTTQTLSYEAHEPMAIRQLETLADQAIDKFDLHRVVIVHRLGEVPLGQASVVVGCSSSHRPATFGALAWIMDTLKRDIPIWKRETYRDGSTEWIHPDQNVQSSACSPSDHQSHDPRSSDQPHPADAETDRE